MAHDPAASGGDRPLGARGDTAASRLILRRRRAAALVNLWAERAVPAYWPAAALVGGLVCAALLGLLDRLGWSWHLGVVAAVACGAAALGVRGRRRLRRPDRGDVDRRLERDSGLTHRPLAVLDDRMAAGAADHPLWARHLARAWDAVPLLRIGWPQPVLAARDPLALRGLLLLGLAAAAVIAGPDAGERLWHGVLPALPASPAVPALEIRAWAAPPAYTGLAPSLLPASGAVSLPSGSRVTVNVTGGSGGIPSLGGQTLDRLDDSSFQTQATPQADGPLVVQRDGVPVARWDLTLRPDVAPVVAWSHPPEARPGRDPQVRLAFRASHAYGIMTLSARFRLRDRPDLPPGETRLPLSGHPREVAGVQLQDFTADPRAGLPATLTLEATDGAGLTGIAPAAELVLPARRFRHPGAQAIVVARQRLALDPEHPGAAAAVLRDLAGKAGIWGDDASPPATLRSLAARLDEPPASAAVEAVQPLLWQLALQLEETTPARTAASLRRAQQDLRAALGSKTSPPLDRAERDRRAEALKQALQRHMEALADQARRTPGSVTPVPPAQAQDAQDTLRDLRAAADAEQMEAARDKMAELDQKLEAMRKASRGAAQQKRDEGRRRGREQMTVLQDLVRREAGLIDHAESRLADPQPDPPDGAAQQRDHDRLTQGALRRLLGELMQQHGDLAGAVPKNLGEADFAMRDTGQALGEAKDEQASAAALRAVQALQQGGQEMDQQLARKFGRPRSGQAQQGQDAQAQDAQSQDAQGQGTSGQDGQSEAQDGAGKGPGGQAAGQGEDEGEQDADQDGEGGGRGQAATQPGDGPGPDGHQRARDPFGRALHEGGTATDGGLDTRVPEEMERARGRAVQDELRRREAQRSRPQPELDYIGRLLDTR